MNDYQSLSYIIRNTERVNRGSFYRPRSVKTPEGLS